MRLLPHYWEGHHPAFPSSPFPPGYNSLSGDIIPAALVSTLHGAGGAMLGLLLRRGQAFTYGARCTAWSALFYVTKTGLDFYIEKEHANKYLATQGIQLDRRVVDRVGRLDQDDLTLGGCIAWLAVASRRRWTHSRLRSITYYVAHSMWAISATYSAYSVSKILQSDNAMLASMIEEDRRLEDEKRSYAAEVHRVHSGLRVETELSQDSEE